MRLLPILAATTIGLFAITAASAQGTKTQTGTGNPTGAQNMDTSNRGNPNEPSAGQTSAGQTTGMSSKSMHKKHKRKHHAM